VHFYAREVRFRVGIEVAEVGRRRGGEGIETNATRTFSMLKRLHPRSVREGFLWMLQSSWVLASVL
jgi:hypothetical protein